MVRDTNKKKHRISKENIDILSKANHKVTTPQSYLRFTSDLQSKEILYIVSCFYTQIISLYTLPVHSHSFPRKFDSQQISLM